MPIIAYSMCGARRECLRTHPPALAPFPEAAAIVLAVLLLMLLATDVLHLEAAGSTLLHVEVCTGMLRAEQVRAMGDRTAFRGNA